MKGLCLILFGSPGSGKGTQAKLLKERLGVAHISTGDMLRERVASGDALGRRVESMMQAGGLVPDDAVNRMVEDRTALDDSRNGFILDGYPRTVSQAVWLVTKFEAEKVRAMVVHLEVDYNVIIARISGRRQCPVCGTLYNLSKDANRVACDLDGAKLEIRSDDREEVVRERLRAYDRQTAPVLAFLRKAGYPCFDVDGGAPQELVAAQVDTLIDHERGASDGQSVGGQPV
ncbi:MAG: nucleoside monophosphate kinase [Acidobacteriota bacterium]